MLLKVLAVIGAAPFFFDVPGVVFGFEGLNFAAWASFVRDGILWSGLGGFERGR